MKFIEHLAIVVLALIYLCGVIQLIKNG